MFVHAVFGVCLLWAGDVEDKSIDKIRRVAETENRDVITRSTDILSTKARAYESLLREQVPYQLKIVVRKGEKEGYSVLEVTGHKVIVSQVLTFVSVLNGTLQTDEPKPQPMTIDGESVFEFIKKHRQQ